MPSQSEIIHQLSRKELRKQLILSQGIFLVLGVVASFFFFGRAGYWFQVLNLDWKDIFLFGFVPALFLVIIEIILYRMLPKSSFDDGGINEKIFRGESVGWIFLIALVVSVSEEVLFRGVIQVAFGYLFASSLFALVHVRYLKKPVLFIMIIVTSFLIGYLFMVTNNLLVTIVFHFLVDFLLGIYTKYTSEVVNNAG